MSNHGITGSKKESGRNPGLPSSLDHRKRVSPPGIRIGREGHHLHCVVNDGRTDGTADVVRTIQAKWGNRLAVHGTKALRSPLRIWNLCSTV